MSSIKPVRADELIGRAIGNFSQFQDPNKRSNAERNDLHPAFFEPEPAIDEPDIGFDNDTHYKRTKQPNKSVPKLGKKDVLKLNPYQGSTYLQHSDDRGSSEIKNPAIKKINPKSFFTLGHDDFLSNQLMSRNKGSMKVPIFKNEIQTSWDLHEPKGNSFTNKVDILEGRMRHMTSRDIIDKDDLISMRSTLGGLRQVNVRVPCEIGVIPAYQTIETVQKMSDKEVGKAEEKNEIYGTMSGKNPDRRRIASYHMGEPTGMFNAGKNRDQYDKGLRFSGTKPGMPSAFGELNGDYLPYNPDGTDAANIMGPNGN
jgi:hypothetical protein